MATILFSLGREFFSEKVRDDWTSFWKGKRSVLVYGSPFLSTKLLADQGDAVAQRNLGIMFERGEGISQSLEEAARYYQLAASQGDAIAQTSLITMNETSRRSRQSNEEILAHQEETNESLLRNQRQIESRDDLVAKQNAIARVTANPQALRNLEPALKYDRDVVKAAVSKDGTILECVKDIYDLDEEIAKIAIANTPYAYFHLHPLYRSRRDFLVQTISHPLCCQSIALHLLLFHDVFLLKEANANLKQNPELCFTAFKKNPAIWSHLSIPVHLNEDDIKQAFQEPTCPESFVLDQIAREPAFIQSFPLKSSLDFVKKALVRNPQMYAYLEERLKNHLEIMKQTLQHADCSKETALAILSRNGLLLLDASQAFQQNLDLGLVAFKQNPEIWNYLSLPVNLSEEDVKQAFQKPTCPESFVFDQIAREPAFIQFFPLKSKLEFVKKALVRNPQVYAYLEERLKNHSEIMKQTLQHADCLKETALAIISRNGLLLFDASQAFQQDLSLGLVAFKQNPAIWSHLKISLSLSQADIQQALQNTYCPLLFAHKQIENDPSLIRFCNRDLQADKALLKKVVTQDGLLIQHIKRVS